MEGKTVRITEYFDLDKGSMLYPHDYFNCPEECPNCRCAVIYSKDGKVTKTERKTDGKVQFTNAHDDAILNYWKDVRNEDRAETFITYNNGVEETISAKPIVNSKNNIYVSDKVGTIKPRKLSDIESWITQSKRIVAEKGAEQPKFVIVSDTELLNTTGGRYNADKNIVYFKIMDKDADTKHSILHELFHWKDAQEYIKQGNSINAGDGFIAIIRKRSKRILDKLGINEKRAFGISTYAKSTYKKGYYEEVYTEYRTVLREGEIK